MSSWRRDRYVLDELKMRDEGLSYSYSKSTPGVRKGRWVCLKSVGLWITKCLQRIAGYCPQGGLGYSIHLTEKQECCRESCVFSFIVRGLIGR
jgi:hypothetical protein